MSIAVAFTTADTASGRTMQLVEGQVLIVGAELRSLDGRLFRVFGWGGSWMLEECP